MSPGLELQSRLAAILPASVNVKAYHLSTLPAATSALFAPLPGQDDERTLCETHFLAVAASQHDESRETLVFAIEILIFTTRNLTTLFVSKADSSGFSSLFNAPKGSPSVVAAITSTFVEFLLEPRLRTSRVVLSLFARSQNQYLFPGSVENAGKHVLDDRQLIKWWCRVLDRVLRLHDNHPSLPCRSTAHLVVPGCDKGETKAFFPPSSRQDPPSDAKWINSYPVELLVADTSKAPRHLVPRFPDDPKSRFLDDLDKDFVDEHGHWRSMKSLDQFWEMMSYRQECSAGRLVGFLWIVFSQGQTTHATLEDLDRGSPLWEFGEPPLPSSLLTPANSQLHSTGIVISDVQSKPDLEVGELTSPPPSSPFEALQTAASSTVPAENLPGDDFSPAVALTNQTTNATPIEHVTETQGELVLNIDQYDTLMDLLLNTDFAGDEKAAESTRGWVQKALELTSTTKFGHLIRGERVLPSLTGLEKTPLPQVNVLNGIRKKRKAENRDDGGAASEPGQAPSVAAVNTLSSGLVRKKPKS